MPDLDRDTEPQSRSDILVNALRYADRYTNPNPDARTEYHHTGLVAITDDLTDALPFTDDVRDLYDRLTDASRDLVARVLSDDLADIDRQRDTHTERLRVLNERRDAYAERLAYLARGRALESDAASEPDTDTDNA